MAKKPPSRQRNSRLKISSGQNLYGLHTCAAALSNPKREFIAAWATPNAAHRLEREFIAANLTPQTVTPRELDQRLGHDAVHQGICLEAMPLPDMALSDLTSPELIVLLDQITDPHNVGAILRSCAAFNVSAVVITARNAPDGSSILAKAASGALEYVPIIKVTNLARAIRELQSRNHQVIGLDSEAPAAIDHLAISRPCALVLGAEGKGLRQLTRTHCDLLAALPMPGKIKSLNVSNAATLALYSLLKRS